MNFTRFGSSKGFTLSEVLIVVVIIGILASLVMPRFAGQTDKAAAAEAIGIMGTIHRALLQYFDEVGSYPEALNAINEIENTLGISASAVRYNWTFATGADGTVTGTRGKVGTLTLSDAGDWGGTGIYVPGGASWPHLPQASAGLDPDPEE